MPTTSIWGTPLPDATSTPSCKGCSPAAWSCSSTSSFLSAATTADRAVVGLSDKRSHLPVRVHEHGFHQCLALECLYSGFQRSGGASRENGTALLHDDTTAIQRLCHVVHGVPRLRTAGVKHRAEYIQVHSSSKGRQL